MTRVIVSIALVALCVPALYAVDDVGLSCPGNKADGSVCPMRMYSTACKPEAYDCSDIDDAEAVCSNYGSTSSDPGGPDAACSNAPSGECRLFTCNGSGYYRNPLERDNVTPWTNGELTQALCCGWRFCPGSACELMIDKQGWHPQGDDKAEYGDIDGDGYCTDAEIGVSTADCGGCGDEVCAERMGENRDNCADCCPAPCCDGVCAVMMGENRQTCPEDCGRCGDRECDAPFESCYPLTVVGSGVEYCPADCERCDLRFCGDGRCTGRETSKSCPQDCAPPTAQLRPIGPIDLFPACIRDAIGGLTACFAKPLNLGHMCSWCGRVARPTPECGGACEPLGEFASDAEWELLFSDRENGMNVGVFTSFGHAVGKLEMLSKPLEGKGHNYNKRLRFRPVRGERYFLAYWPGDRTKRGVMLPFDLQARPVR